MGARHMRQSAWALLIAVLTASPAAAQTTRVAVALDSRLEGPAAPFFVAADKGYYRAEGLSVAVDWPSNAPNGAPDSINRLAAGTHEIGVADINALIKYRDANPGKPIKAVFMLYNRPAYAVVARKSRGISTPKDLEGKRLGAPGREGAFAQWPIFARLNDIDTSKVMIENVGLPVRDPMLAAGQLDAVTGLSFSAYPNMKERGVPANDLVVLLMADYGVELYGQAIIVSPKFAVENPDAVKGFLRAFTRALKDTVRSPATALDSVLKRTESARKETEMERLTMAIRDNIVTPEVKANGYGAIDSARFNRAIEQIAIGYKFRTAKPKVEDIFDGSFLPPAAERRSN